MDTQRAQRLKARHEASNRGWTLALNFWDPYSHYFKKAKFLGGSEWTDLSFRCPSTFAAIHAISPIEPPPR